MSYDSTDTPPEKVLQIMANYICRIHACKDEFQRGKLAEQAYQYVYSGCLAEGAPHVIQGVAWNFQIQEEANAWKELCGMWVGACREAQYKCCCNEALRVDLPPEEPEGV